MLQRIKEGRPKPATVDIKTNDHQTPNKKESLNIISLNPTSIVRVLVTLAFILLVVDIAYQVTAYLFGKPDVYGLRFFSFDSEDNLPSAYSTLLILIAALLLSIITVLKNKQTGVMAFQWAVLTAGFFLMAMDEELSLHEELIIPIRSILDTDHYGVFYYSWVIPAIVLVVALGLFFLKFLMRLPAKTRFHFIVAGALYLGGCLGVELIGGRYDELYGNENVTYNLIATFEESLEMAGIIVFIWALLVYIADTLKKVQFHVKGRKEGAVGRD